MSYFIFSKNSDNLTGLIYRIAENQSDLNNLNIIKSDYKIIEDSEVNFNNVKYGTKFVTQYSGDIVSYEDNIYFYADIVKDGNLIITAKEILKTYVFATKRSIKQFLDNNSNHPLYSRWDNYYNQLNNLNLDSITYPLNKSLEQYFKDLNQPSYHPLQLP
jgi:hypothetical protein